jgi:L-threonylcarbamoyladenylate synthase
VDFIDIDVTKPDIQSLQAAAELLEQGYPVVFPSDTTNGILMRFTPENAAKLHALRREDSTKPFLVVVSEDSDWRSLINADAMPRENLDTVLHSWPGPTTLVFSKAGTLSYPAAESIAIRMPSAENNKAFHTLIQLCDFPVMAPSFNRPGEPVITDKKTAAEKFPEIQYAFWDVRFQPQPPSAIWDLRAVPPLKLR